MIGTRILHFRIDEKLGEGGMGEVFLAMDTKLDRQVALKFLPPYLSQDPEFKARFEHEARAAAALRHPNIVTIYDLLEHEGRQFIVMEAVSGESLDHLIRHGDMSLEQSLEIAEQICEGLHEAHEAGIVHRDIKPSNIVIDAKGRARILDFGLAKSPKATDLTKTGTTVGTLAYASPEQLSGKPVDPRTDLYSLGAVLYQMITGRTPFKGEYEEAIRYSILHSEPEPLARYKSGVPAELQRIQSRLLAKEPDLRYQSADEVLSDLGTLQESPDWSGSGTLSDLPGLAPPSRRRMKNVAVASAMVILAILIVVFRPWRMIQPTHEAEAMENRLVVTYFDNLADPADSGKLGEVTANLLIAGLSESKSIQVVSSQRLYDLYEQLGNPTTEGAHRQTSGEIARRARAKWMLLGTVVREKPSLALSAQLVEVATGNAIASQRATGGEGDDLFALVDKLVTEVSADLSSRSGEVSESVPGVAEVTTKSESAYKHYVAGMRLLYQYNVAEAVREFRKARVYDSTFAMVHFRLATSYFLSRRGVISASDLERAVRFASRASTKERAYIEAFGLAQSGHYPEATEKLQWIAKRYPDEKEAFIFWGGVELYMRRSPSQALIAFRQVVQLDTSYGLAYNCLAYTHAALGDWEQAMENVERYIKLTPGEVNPYDSKGDLYALRGDLDRAIATYRRALRMEDSLQLERPLCQSCGNLGDMLLLKGDYRAAEQAYRRLLSSELPELRHSGRYHLAFIPAVQGRLRNALSYLDQAINADSLDYGRAVSAGPASLKAEIQFLRGRPDSALADIDRSVEIAKAWHGDFQFLPWRIRYLSRLGKSTEAKTDLDRLAKAMTQTSPVDDWHYTLAQGWMSLEQGRPEDAVKIFDSTRSALVKAFWPYELFQYELGFAYLAAGRFGEAISQYQAILPTFSSECGNYPIYRPLVHYQLGMAFEGSGSGARAAEEYQKFLNTWKDADPDLPQFIDAKARLARLAP